MIRRVRRKRIPEKQKYAHQFAKVTEEAVRIAPRCQHFGHCGGCTLQDLDYADQMAAKRQVFWRLIGKLKVRWALRGIMPEVEASAEPFGYRQRMDFVFAFGKSGMRGSGFDDVVDLQECHLVGAPGWRAFSRARELAVAAGIPDYDYLAHAGQLRYAVLRCNRAGEVLLALVTRDRDHDAQLEQVAQTLLAEGLVVGVHHLINEARRDSSMGASVRHWGQEQIEERIDELRFLIGPNTFFQANPAIAERAYRHIADWLAPLKPTLGLDLYSGTGTIAAILSRSCQRVIAVENNPHNQAPAEANFAANGITNIDYRLEDVAVFLKTFTEPVDALVLNPPRGGVGAKALAPIIALGPERIAYMSCNALTLLEDCRTLGPHYQPAAIWVLDMFPQTRHFEVLICFEKRVAELDDPAGD
ncbi:MAG: 23S rRNA (uracil(1939)-C(5))-methyltransferase RlmD [Planctomycetota bacterium]|jgi:23S rRNA (uracil-5-)-methyltransferase RumA|nr:23S rRNA (uracil(1939)-C(5))-methyltransferase RlmD [Planctomycetota bacterium]